MNRIFNGSTDFLYTRIPKDQLFEISSEDSSKRELRVCQLFKANDTEPSFWEVSVGEHQATNLFRCLTLPFSVLKFSGQIYPLGSQNEVKKIVEKTVEEVIPVRNLSELVSGYLDYLSRPTNQKEIELDLPPALIPHRVWR